MNKLLNIYNAHTGKIIFTTGAVLGLVVGLLVGWVLWPASYYNATPESLRRGDIQDEHLVLVARDYAATGNLDQAKMRLGLEHWKRDNPVTLLQELGLRRGGQDGEHLQALAEALDQELQAEETTPPDEGGQASLLQRALPVLQICGAGLIAAALAGLAYLGISRLRRREPRPVSERATAYQVVEERTEWEEEAAPPFRQFKTTYTLGDDFYDPSFSIENEGGDFLGECGVGISEAIGVGDPKKVTALEVWLFDKNDIRTITKVLMSEFAFHDEALRTKLASKGELTLAELGTEIALETATLILRAQVTDMQYGHGQLPPSSFFQRVTVDIGVWFVPEGEAHTAPDLAIPSTP